MRSLLGSMLLDCGVSLLVSRDDDGIERATTTSKVGATRAVFGKKGCGFHKEHHRWNNRILLPHDLNRHDIYVRVMDPNDVIFDESILDLARAASVALRGVLQDTYTASACDARMILKVKVTTISDGTSAGSFAANKDPSSGWGYAGIGVAWKLLSNELSSSFPSPPSSQADKVQEEESRDDSLTLDDDAEDEIPYEPKPYDGGFEVMEQSMGYDEMYCGKNVGAEIVTRQLAPECSLAILSRIGFDDQSFYKERLCPKPKSYQSLEMIWQESNNYVVFNSDSHEEDGHGAEVVPKGFAAERSFELLSQVYLKRVSTQ